ncbi:MAG: sigma-70 family RNA polymerase sigma factor [Ectothiorhodospiraceae bacterium]|nr:sigma-70 family RNA polymerase sigma factor [Chromatiales bacterium]MCP5153741.1 sigma-70 family RNA polymerase sigma factor [Ectothiorhodospiraceae bacterium]
MTPVRGLIVEQIPRLRRYARALTGDQSRADDLVQDCLERALGRTRLWKPGTNIRAWLFTIMHNLFVNDLRRNKGGLRSLDDATLAQQESADGDGLAAMELRDIDRALAQLTPEHREVLLLVAVEQLTYQEAADALGIPVGTVMSRLARGRARLAEVLEDGPGRGLRRVK